jgi:hypothetical protein
MKNNVVNWWSIISKLRYDNSLWDYLEPAEMMEIVQLVKEAKEMIAGLEKYVRIDLRPALQKLNLISDIRVRKIHSHKFQTNITKMKRINKPIVYSVI